MEDHQQQGIFSKAIKRMGHPLADNQLDINWQTIEVLYSRTPTENHQLRN